MTSRSAVSTGAETRARIIETADRLFYENGFEATSFADIAAEVKLSRGNFYYHFRTKDEILDAVIGLRTERTRAMLGCWERDSDSPTMRLLSFAGVLVDNRAKIMAYGCPVGTLCAELAKLDHAARASAAAIFTVFREWLAEQFVAIGQAPQADALAMHLLMRSQGVAALAAAFGDEAFIDRELAAIERWLAALAPGKEPPCISSF